MVQDLLMFANSLMSAIPWPPPRLGGEIVSVFGAAAVGMGVFFLALRIMRR